MSATATGWEPWLAPGERLLWQGAPARGLRLSKVDWVLIPFSLVWCGFAVVWTGMAIAGGLPVVAILIGVVFVIIGLFMVIGRFLWDAHVRAGTRYALTDRRAFIATRHFGRRLRSFPITAATPIEVEAGKTTSIWFALSPTGRRIGTARHGTMPERHGFQHLIDGPEVLALMRHVQREATETA